MTRLVAASEEVDGQAKCHLWAALPTRGRRGGDIPCGTGCRVRRVLCSTRLGDGGSTRGSATRAPNPFGQRCAPRCRRHDGAGRGVARTVAGIPLERPPTFARPRACLLSQ